MSVPVLVLMLASMVSVLSLSLQDHAAHAAAEDLAELRAEHAATAYVAGCFSADGCAVPSAPTRACATRDGAVVVTVDVPWSPTLWKALTPVSATSYVAFDPLLGDTASSRATAGLRPCS